MELLLAVPTKYIRSVKASLLFIVLTVLSGAYECRTFAIGRIIINSFIEFI